MIKFPTGARTFSRAWGPLTLQPGLFLWQQSGREAHYSSPSTAEVKNKWSYIPYAPIRRRGVHKDNFTFTHTGMSCYLISEDHCKGLHIINWHDRTDEHKIGSTLSEHVFNLHLYNWPMHPSPSRKSFFNYRSMLFPASCSVYVAGNATCMCT